MTIAFTVINFVLVKLQSEHWNILSKKYRESARSDMAVQMKQYNNNKGGKGFRGNRLKRPDSSEIELVEVVDDDEDEDDGE